MSGREGEIVEDTLELYRRAQWHFDLDDPISAAQYLSTVVEEQPEATGALLLLARSYFRSAQLSRAERTYARVVDLNPADAEARIGLARSLERQGRLEEALPHARVAAALAPGPQHLHALARLERRVNPPGS